MAVWLERPLFVSLFFRFCFATNVRGSSISGCAFSNKQFIVEPAFATDRYELYVDHIGKANRQQYAKIL